MEDEQALLRISRAALEGLGYRVLAAGSPREAFEASAGAGGRIDLVVADVVMPEHSGREVAERVKREHPEAKVLYVSGYPADVLGRNGILGDGVRLLPKPFGRRELARAVRQALDEG
ncbi:MAG: response regulator [Anaeromyxobacter sp.]